MEITPFLIYWIMQADQIAKAFILITTVMVIISVVLTSIYYASRADNRGEGRDSSIIHGGIVIMSVIITSLSLIGAVLFPSTKTLVVMYGVPTAISAAKELELDVTAKRSIQSLNKLMEEYIADKK